MFRLLLLLTLLLGLNAYAQRGGERARVTPPPQDCEKVVRRVLLDQYTREVRAFAMAKPLIQKIRDQMAPKPNAPNPSPWGACNSLTKPGPACSVSDSGEFITLYWRESRRKLVLAPREIPSNFSAQDLVMLTCLPDEGLDQCFTPGDQVRRHPEVKRNKCEDFIPQGDFPFDDQVQRDYETEQELNRRGRGQPGARGSMPRPGSP